MLNTYLFQFMLLKHTVSPKRVIVDLPQYRGLNSYINLCKMRFAQLVIGPAGSGKSTYCSTLATHAQNSGRKIDVVNLDPAAEHFTYEPLFDVRDLISVEDVMEDEAVSYTHLTLPTKA